MQRKYSKKKKTEGKKKPSKWNKVPKRILEDNNFPGVSHVFTPHGGLSHKLLNSLRPGTPLTQEKAHSTGRQSTRLDAVMCEFSSRVWQQQELAHVSAFPPPWLPLRVFASHRGINSDSAGLCRSSLRGSQEPILNAQHCTCLLYWLFSTDGLTSGGFGDVQRGCLSQTKLIPKHSQLGSWGQDFAVQTNQSLVQVSIYCLSAGSWRVDLYNIPGPNCSRTRP